MALVVVTDYSDVAIKPSTLARFASNKHRQGRWPEHRVRNAVVRVAKHASTQAWMRGRVLTAL